MTKAEIVSLVKNTLKKVDETSSLREPFLIRHIGIVYEQMFNELYRQDRQGISKYTTLVEEVLSTSDDLTEGRAIPTIPITLPRESGGVFEFYLRKGSAAPVVYTKVTFVLTSFEGYRYASDSSFDTADMKGNRIAAIQGGTLYGNASVGADPGGTASLWYRMIPKFSELASTDEVMLPGGNSEMFVDRVLDTIIHVAPTDLINDNA